MGNHSNFAKPSGCQGCFVTFMSILLIAGAFGYYGYQKIFHKELFEIPKIDYPSDQLKFIDALVEQKNLLNDNNGVEWAKGLNAIRKKEVQEERNERYYQKFDAIIGDRLQGKMDRWVGILSGIHVVPGGNRDAGRIEFELVCPVQKSSGKYKVVLSTETSFDKSSPVGGKLRDMHVGDLVTFNANLNKSRYIYVNRPNQLERKEKHDTIIKGDEDYDGMCRFVFVISDDVELLESKQLATEHGKGRGLW